MNELEQEIAQYVQRKYERGMALKANQEMAESAQLIDEEELFKSTALKIASLEARVAKLEQS